MFLLIQITWFVTTIKNWYFARSDGEFWVFRLLCSLTQYVLDEMSTRIDDLEKNIADLMTQAGVEEIEATPEKAKEGQGS